jgi:hypothetical protein
MMQNAFFPDWKISLQVRKRSSAELPVTAEILSKSQIFQCNSKVSETTFDTKLNFVNVFSNASAATPSATFAMMYAFMTKSNESCVEPNEVIYFNFDW